MSEQKMKKNISNAKPSSQLGLTLVELLVASFLGLLLVGVVASMYITSVGSFRSSTELSKVQENTRFALHFIEQSLREAGYSKCGNETKDYNFLSDPSNSTAGGGVLGWDYSGTDINDPALTLAYADLNEDSSDAEITAARAANTAATGNWVSIGTAPSLNDVITNFLPMAGSDIISLTAEEERSDIFITGTPGNTLNLGAGSASLPQGAIVKVGSCTERNIFAKTNNLNANSMAAGNGSGNINRNARPPSGQFWSQAWGPDSRIFSDVTKVYYVGTGASGLPSLFVAESVCGFDVGGCSGTVAPTELVEGVENMQIVYGVDSDADGVANRYFSADDVGDFANVVAIRISLLMRSNERSEADNNDPFILADAVNIDPIDKGVLRYVVNSTIELRNRGN